MFWPLGTDRPIHKPTVVTYVLIALNLVVFIVLLFISGSDEARSRSLERGFMLVPGESAAWTYVTYQFLHGGFWHIGGNMLFLYVFGPNVEDRLGRIGFSFFYLASGVGAGLLHAHFVDNPVIGASGSIAGVTGAYLVMFPKTRIKLLIIFFLIGIYWLPAYLFIAMRIFWDFLMTGTGRSGNIATLAHIGGYLTGISVGLVLLGFKIIPREPYDLFTIARQANRRRELREIGYQQERKTKRIREGRERPSGLDKKKSDALAEARAEVTSKVSTGDLEGAAEAYKALLAKYGATPTGATLARRPQYELANYLFKSGDYQTADIAYERLLEAYPNDTERGQIRVMLGRINARYLNDPVKAKEHLETALEQLHDEATIEIARRELEDLG